MIIPISIETPVRRMPTANYALMGINVFLFILLDYLGIKELAAWKREHLILNIADPHLYQFLSYQFLHGDLVHLAGNMVFLWVFGNAVNGKLGNVPYLLFYVAGGVFAAWGFSLAKANEHAMLLGASGSIAAVTTACLVLFPRSKVKVLYWFFFIGFFELPAMVLIVLKIVLWDNVIAPSLGGSGGVAHGAHLAGYVFGFSATLMMLMFRTVARDHFDLLSLWDRANRRRQWRSAMASPTARAIATHGSVARTATVSRSTVEQESKLDLRSELREKIGEQLASGDVSGACETFQTLIADDAQQCLSERQQLQVAREFYRIGRFPQAAASFDRFLEVYKHSTEASEVRLLLGIVYARDLRQYEAADKHLSRSYEGLAEGPRKKQCSQWLRDVRAALGRPAPEG